MSESLSHERSVLPSAHPSPHVLTVKAIHVASREILARGTPVRGSSRSWMLLGLEARTERTFSRTKCACRSRTIRRRKCRPDH